VYAALIRVLRTSSFRLTLLYALLFSTSAVILFAVIYWQTAVYMTGELDAAIDSDLTELETAMRTGGTHAVAATIEDRVWQMPSGPMLYLLQDRGGKALAGNLPAMRRRVGTFDFAAAGLDGRKRQIHACGTDLAGGDYLVVGIHARMRDEMCRLVLRAFGWSFAITLVLAFGGGAVISGGMLRRVEAIGRTAREIMAGDFSRRLPVRGADDEFDRLTASLNAMLDRTETSIETIRHVSNDIAHDLRTPLTRLRQRLELARSRARSADELRAAIDHSIGEVDGILETFGALLRIAEVESGRAARHFREIDLSELLHTMVEVYQPMAEERGQSFAADIDEGLRVDGDHELLAQMLANLIENAMKHSPPDAVIALSAGATGGDVEMLLTDTGPGIPEEERKRVFRRFYRLETSRTTPGNGLGLTLVGAVAALHRIAIELGDNDPGLRTRLRIPQAAAQPKEPRALLQTSGCGA
jgi:signal transduction histidine kinase